MIHVEAMYLSSYQIDRPIVKSEVYRSTELGDAHGRHARVPKAGARAI